MASPQKLSPAEAAALAVAQFEKCKDDFLYFLNFVKIEEPPQLATGYTGGATPLALWDHIVTLAEGFLTNTLDVTLKARQIGWTTIAAAFVAWLMRFKKNTFIPMISQGQLEAGDLRGKVRDILANLPPEWPPFTFDPDATLELGIKEMNSLARALPSTKDAGRSTTATLVLIDEGEFQEYLSSTMRAIKPTIDAGGQIIMGSTVDKSRAKSAFKNIYINSQRKGHKGKNGWKGRFLGWDVRPGRDQEWYQARLAEAEADDELGMDARLFMEQEYPRSEDEALRPSEFISAFDKQSLDLMWDYRKPAVEVGEGGYMRMYMRYRPGFRYWAASDIGLGKGGGDHSVTVILDQQGWAVCHLMSRSLGVDTFTDRSIDMLKLYKNPLWAIEDNSYGASALSYAHDAHYPRLYRRRVGNSDKTELGWNTNKNTRGLMWNHLINEVKAGNVWVPSEDGLAQMYQVMWDPEKERAEAQAGGHDDYPTALAIAREIKDLRPNYAGDSSKPLVPGSRF